MPLSRSGHLAALRTAVARQPVTLLTGPRQSGKTTLARHLLPATDRNYFDLEDPVSRARLAEPMTALRPLRGLVVIDEVQRVPELFPVLRVLADRRPRLARFLILGSASGALLRQGSESLAGRIGYHNLGGFTVRETGGEALERLWRRGGFPLSFTARTEAASVVWRRAFIDTLLERDLPQWGVRVPSTTLRRFWAMVAHMHGQVWSSADPARALGMSEVSIRRYLDLLTDAFMLRQLPPWHANISKRQVKSPKVYVRDPGLLHALLGLPTQRDLEHHPKYGASWEGFVIEEVLATEPHDEAAFWATHHGAEIDLVLRRGSKLFGVEVKRTDAPQMTPSIRIAMNDLSLESVAVIYPGEHRYQITDNVHAVPARELAEPGALFGKRR
jgi:uncharacterized protein